MFDEWRFRWQLKNLQNDRRDTRKRHEPLLKKARETSTAAHDQAFYNYIEDQNEIDDMIAELEHNHMTDLAERFDIELMPLRWSASAGEEDGNWKRSRFTGKYFISKKEVARLRGAIRQEKKERFDESMRWLPPIVSFLSLAVAILALLVNASDKMSRPSPSPCSPSPVGAPAPMPHPSSRGVP